MKFKAIAVLLSVFLLFSYQAEAKKKVKTGLEIGNKAPELKFLSPNGEVISLSSLKGKMVLVDFWASWCGPCRRENPHVVKAFHEFKDEKFKNGNGFTIYSVSLDKTKDRWVKAIEQDALEWPYHVSDLLGWRSKAAAIYGVRGIPDNFLIDGDGIIVGKGLRGANLELVLKKLTK
ncbi:TlpA family protein disulfide reductase [Labilibacter sediminis]|nr:TlpA family protein disulfide reductase [Labilibacter sediminis]